jgi:hypothetical protein
MALLRGVFAETRIQIETTLKRTVKKAMTSSRGVIHSRRANVHHFIKLRDSIVDETDAYIDTAFLYIL